jgi:hypothetical protein
MRYEINKSQSQLTLGQKITLKIKEVKNIDQISIKALALKDDTAVIEINPRAAGQFELIPYALGPIEITVFEDGKALEQKVTFNVLEKYPQQTELLPSFGPFTRYGDMFLLLILMILAGVLWKVLSSRKKAIQVVASVKTMADYLQEWDQILKIQNLETKISKSSLWLKNFMTEYLKEPSNHLTTPEMKSHRKFLEFCDGVKFSDQDHSSAKSEFESLSADITRWLTEVSQ